MKKPFLKIFTYIKKIAKVVLWFLAICFFLNTIGVVTSRDGVQRAIQANHESLNDFVKTSEFVRQYHEENGVYPFSDVVADALTDGDIFFNVVPREKFDGHKTDFNSEFDPPITDAFVLSQWSGDYYDYYSYPSGATSLEFDSKDYYLVSKLFSGLLFFSISLICSALLYFCFYKKARPLE